MYSSSISQEEHEKALDFVKRILRRKSESIPNKFGDRSGREKFQNQLDGKIGEILVSKIYGGDPDFSVFHGHETHDFKLNGKQLSVKTIPTYGRLYMVPPGDYAYVEQTLHVLCKIEKDKRSGMVSKVLTEEGFSKHRVLYRKGTEISMIRSHFASHRNEPLSPETDKVLTRNKSKYLQEDNFAVTQDIFDQYGLDLRNPEPVTTSWSKDDFLPGILK